MTRRSHLPRPGDSTLRADASAEGAHPENEIRLDRRPRVGVLGVQGDVSEHVAVLERAGARASWVKRAEDLDAVDGLILPGGESTTFRRLLDFEDLLSCIQDRYRGGMPVFGTCAGAILMADEVIGSETPHLSLVPMTVRRNAFGRQRESFVTRLDVDGLEGGPLKAIFIRAPLIERVGAGVEVVATLGGAIVLAESDQALVATFHPELTPDLRLHRRFIDKVNATVSSANPRSEAL